MTENPNPPYDLDAIRAQFPALHQSVAGNTPIFLDGPGGAQANQHTIAAMQAYMTQGVANLGSSYFTGVHTEETMQTARESVASLVNASADEIVFGPTATMLMFNLSRAISREWQAGDEIIVSAMDHYSNVSSWQQAAEDKGVIVHVIPFDEQTWALDYEQLIGKLSAKTRVVAFGLASNLLGSITDAQRIVKAAQDVGALTFIDAVHYAPHQLLDVQAIGCDFCVMSAYKFSGPHVSALYGKADHLARFQPYKVEPATNQRPHAWEQGTQSFESLAGFTAAIEYLASLSGTMSGDLRARLETGFDHIVDHESQLSAHFLQAIADIPELTLYGKTSVDGRTPTFAFRLANSSPADFVDYCAQQQCCFGSGHFYALGVVQQLGLQDTGGLIRIGFMHYSTIAEIDQFCDHIKAFLSVSA